MLLLSPQNRLNRAGIDRILAAARAALIRPDHARLTIDKLEHLGTHVCAMAAAYAHIFIYNRSLRHGVSPDKTALRFYVLYGLFVMK
jgi:hypothetical protein